MNGSEAPLLHGLLEIIGLGFFAEFGFMQRALLGCLVLSISAAPIGVFLMLRRMSLTGDAMAHAVLPGAAIGFLASGLSVWAMTLGGIVAGLLVAVASGWVARATVLKEDASLAVFYLLSLALGVLIVSTRGSNVDLLHVLFGSVLALNNEAILLLVGICSISCISLALMFRPLVLECLDPKYLQMVSGWSATAHYGFLVLVVINLVAGFHALGTLLAVGFMVLPAASARFWVDEISRLILVSVVIAALGSALGLVASYQFDLPSGPAIILALGLIYLLSMSLGRRGLFVTLSRQPKHLEA
jgi:zinc/manganese transport system permease protein